MRTDADFVEVRGTLRCAKQLVMKLISLDGKKQILQSKNVQKIS